MGCASTIVVRVVVVDRAVNSEIEKFFKTNHYMETEVPLQVQNEKQTGKNRKKIITIVSLSIIILSFAGYGLRVLYEKEITKYRMNEALYAKKNQQAYLVSFLGNDPRLLQETFLADIDNGINDKFTKSDAYFLTHRYFDNGGNVYEIYDYVNSHKSLAFLKEAEDIYPSIFEQVKDKSLSSVPYSTSSLYAILAYLEVLDRYGYADAAALGTLANQYAKTAYFTKKKAELNSVKGVDISPVEKNIVEINTKKAVNFELKAKESLIKVAEENEFVLDDLRDRPKVLEEKRLEGILAHNLLVGLNQYAAALRYLEAVGFDISVVKSPVSAADIFAFNMTLSKQFVPELEIFTSLLNASTLSLVSPESTDALRMALQPILDFDTSKTKPQGIIIGIIDAKNSKFTGLDIYSKINITTLGNLVPEFKAWLISNEWKDADFE